MDIVPYPGFNVKWLHACRRQASYERQGRSISCFAELSIFAIRRSDTTNDAIYLKAVCTNAKHPITFGDVKLHTTIDFLISIC